MELAKTNSAISVTTATFGLENVSARDMVIPKILQVQKMSEDFKPGTTNEGDFIDSLDGTNFGQSFSCQVFHISKAWRVYADTEKKQYLRTEKVTAENENADYTFRDLVYQLSVLVGDDVGTRSPYGISLQKTNLQCARRLISVFTKKGGTAGVIVTFCGKPEKNDKGSWVKWDFKIERDATTEEIGEAREWYDRMSSGSVKHHEEPVTTTVTPTDDLPF